MGRWLRRFGWLLLACLAIALVYCAGTPPPMESHAFLAGPAPPLEGALAPNRALAACEIFGVDEIDGPEEFAFDREGRLYAGTNDGSVVRVTFADPAPPRIEVFAEPGGRPNGLSFDAAGNLLASDGHTVPSSWIDPSGGVRPFPVEHGQDSAIASDGTFYLPRHPNPEPTDDLPVYVLRLIGEARPDGELVAYDPATGSLEVLLTGLIWPDGVALSAAEDFVVVGEVSAYRISRYWLKGPKAGTGDRLIENLPGFVDGLASDGNGLFYASIAVPRSGLLDWLHRRPGIKDQLARLLSPAFAQRVTASPPGTPRGYALVVAIDESGRIVRSFHDPETAIGPGVNAAEPRGDELFIGSLTGRGIGRCPLGG